MNAPMTPDREQEIRAREQAATPGPWLREDDQQRLERFVTNESGTLDINFGYLGNNNQANVAFVVDARSAVPELLTEVDRLRKVLSEAADQVAELESDLGGASADNARLRAEVARWRERTEEAETSEAQLKGQVRGLRAYVDQLEAARTTAAADRDKQIIAWLEKKAREEGTSNKDSRVRATATYRLADKLSRGAVRPACPPVSPEDPHDSPLHHSYALGRDLPEVKRPAGACSACGDLPEQWCPDCAACRKGCHGGADGNPCAHPNARWTVTS
ncbi:coiled-coil domain-containing protein [Streptomyces bacillaris]|uniref:hypothetical protein n=1 Tax=Streptomyces bacillaris TaxID=68179 RepID=UPI00382DF548